MKEIYTIERQSYSDHRVDFFEKKEEWLKKMDADSEQEHTRGMGDGITVSIYEVPDDAYVSISTDRGWTGEEYRGRRSYADREEIIITTEDADGEEVEESIGEPIASQDISYWYVREIEDENDENHGKYISNNGDIYETEEEGRDIEKPSQYLFI